jgi:hypothetical protein
MKAAKDDGCLLKLELAFAEMGKFGQEARHTSEHPVLLLQQEVACGDASSFRY